jgi:hypothetical protein
MLGLRLLDCWLGVRQRVSSNPTLFKTTVLTNGRRCYCGSSLDSRAAPKAGILGNCNMKCAGDSTQNCGGSKAISLYQKCTGTCKNAGSGTIPLSPSTGNDTTPVVQPISSPVAPWSNSSSIVSNPVISATSSAVPVVQQPTSIISSDINIAPSEPPTPPVPTVSKHTTLATVTKAPTSISKHVASLHSLVRTTTYVYTEYYWS